MDPTQPDDTRTKQSPETSGEADLPLELDRVKTFLREHPAALETDRELVSLLTPPAYRNGRNVLDMQSFMIDRLKRQAEENENREGKVRAAVAADALDERRVQKAVVALACARGFDHLIEVITEDLPRLLTVQTVLIGIESSEGTEPHPTSPPSSSPLGAGPVRLLKQGMVEEILGPKKPILFGEPPEDMRLFPASAGPIRSYCAASLTFTKSAPPGILLVGARNSGRFSRNGGRSRYSFLARMVEETTRLWLDLPPL